MPDRAATVKPTREQMQALFQEDAALSREMAAHLMNSPQERETWIRCAELLEVDPYTGQRLPVIVYKRPAWRLRGMSVAISIIVVIVAFVKSAMLGQDLAWYWGAAFAVSIATLCWIIVSTMRFAIQLEQET